LSKPIFSYEQLYVAFFIVQSK